MDNSKTKEDQKTKYLEGSRALDTQYKSVYDFLSKRIKRDFRSFFEGYFDLASDKFENIPTTIVRKALEDAWNDNSDPRDLKG